MRLIYEKEVNSYIQLIFTNVNINKQQFLSVAMKTLIGHEILLTDT
ncbi:hypothetical protein NA63_0417 [Flavobacteriaceae bacterium MAR_2010_105]|nr:hypothetical protein NA63_0417 [Flavobacteriaceae bacterium MAR_2010_105]